MKKRKNSRRLNWLLALVVSLCVIVLEGCSPTESTGETFETYSNPNLESGQDKEILDISAGVSPKTVLETDNSTER